MVKKFVIYNDNGTSNVCIKQLSLFFKKNDFDYYTCNANNILNDDILKKTDCFIMPGGRDIPYCMSLNGKGNNKISNFVKNGGIYLGICAGAYYAHKKIYWKNNTEKIQENRELAFFNSVANGPLIKPYNANTNQGGALVNISYKQIKTTVYYQGGPIMEIDTNTKIIAYFSHKGVKYPAIIKKNIENGMAIAISPHIEYSNNYLNSINIQTCNKRESIFYDLINNL